MTSNHGKGTPGAIEWADQHGADLASIPTNNPDGLVDVEDIYAAARAARAHQQHKVTAASGPWASGEHPAAWAYRTGRVTAQSMHQWAARYATDPAGVARVLTELAPVLAPTNAVAGRIPATAASPARNAGGYLNAVEELRDQHPASVARAAAAVPPPALFPGSGDYPAATASGIDPTVLAALPWRARLAAAWEPNRLRALAMVRDYSGPDGEYMAAVELGNNPAVEAYILSVHGWYATAGVGDEPDGDPLSDDEYAELFGRNGRPGQAPQQSGS